MEIWVRDIIPDILLENSIEIIVDGMKNLVKGVNLISENQAKLNDGTPAREGLTEHLAPGSFFKMKGIILSIFKDGTWISVHLNTLAGIYDDDLRNIVYSLEFE